VAVIWHNPTALRGSRPTAGYAGLPAVPLWPTRYGRWPRRPAGPKAPRPLVAAPLGRACCAAVPAPPDPHTRGDPTLTSGPVRIGWATTSSLPGISVWQGRRLPKVETRFVGTHHATSLSSLACWRPRSRRTSTFQGQLSDRRRASFGSYGPRTGRPPVRPAELRINDAPVLRWLRLRPRPFAHSIDAPRGARTGRRHPPAVSAPFR
jgi:hypothetical protein